MISDTLFEAAEQIEGYMVEGRKHFSDAEQTMIEAVCEHMRTVQAYLDKPPFIGTKRETVLENEAGK